MRQVPAVIVLAFTMIGTRAAGQVQSEVEPNNSAATANALTSNPMKVKADIFGNGDVDWFSFTGALGNRVYAATMTAHSGTGSGDSVMTLLASDGSTVIESDDENGSLNTNASGLAGVTLPANGTYYIRVNHFSSTGQLLDYDLYVQVQSGAPVAETEPNDATPQRLRGSRWVAGTMSSAADLDIYSVTANAGDTIFASLDLDPELDAGEFNGILGLGVFDGNFLAVNDTGGAGPDSESNFLTVPVAGTYFIRVASTSLFNTYQLSISVLSPQACANSASTYASTNVPVAIPTGPALVSSTLNVPGNPRIGNLRVSIHLQHTSMPDLDVTLISPSGTAVDLFTDVGSNSFTTMDVTLDDQAAIPISAFIVVNGMRSQTELNYRLEWFKGMRAGGVWTLEVRDDATGNGGTLLGWGLEICEQPLAACAHPAVIYASDFESNDGGFTHSGIVEQWGRGTPSAAPVTNAYSGSNCWKTNLIGNYNNSSDQDLISPVINLAGAQPPVYLRWAQKHQMERASLDRAFVDVQNPGGLNPKRVWEWRGPTMSDLVGNPGVTIAEAAGWAEMEADISAYAGQQIQVRFHLDSDATGAFAGLAIDDVSVTACGQAPCAADVNGDLQVNVTDLLAVIGTWGPCTGCPPTHCSADVAPVGPPQGDCQINVSDLLLIIGAWGACP